MDKEQTLKALEEKYQPLLEKTGFEQAQAEEAHRQMLSEYDGKRTEIETYFQALDDQQRISDIINNPPTI